MALYSTFEARCRIENWYINKVRALSHCDTFFIDDEERLENWSELVFSQLVDERRDTMDLPSVLALVQALNGRHLTRDLDGNRRRSKTLNEGSYSSYLTLLHRSLLFEFPDLKIRQDGFEISVAGEKSEGCLTLRGSDPATRVGSAEALLGDPRTVAKGLQDQVLVCAALQVLEQATAGLKVIL